MDAHCLHILDVGCIVLRIYSKINAIALNCATSIGGYSVTITVYVQARAQRDKLRIYGNYAVTTLQPGCSPSGS
jgi:hypothetical protein